MAEQDPGDATHMIPGARKSTGSSPSHLVTISPSAQRRGRSAMPRAAAAQPSSPVRQHGAAVQGQRGAAFGGSVPLPETLQGFVRGQCFVIPCSARVLCSHALESGPSQPLPLFIFLDLEEIIIFKLLPPCLCCGSNVTVGWRAQEAQGEMGSNCIKSVSFKNQLKSAPLHSPG